MATLAGCSNNRRNPQRTVTPEATPTDGATPETTPRASPTEPSVYADRFGSIVNMASMGADTRGNRDVFSIIDSHTDDDTLLYFPPGRYLMTDTVHFLDFDNFGIVGERATIVPPDGYEGVLFDIGRPDQAKNLLIEGLEFDYRAPETGPRPLSVLAGGEVTIRDITVTGKQDAGWGMMRLDITDPNSVGTVERLRLPDGSTAETSATGCLVGDEHRGEIHFVDCHIEGFADNGLYASPDRGAVRVTGGYYANCNTSSLRVGDNSVVRGAHVRCNSAPPGFKNMRGLRLRLGSNVLVENCTIDIQKVGGSDGALVLEDELEAATIRNTTIQVNADDINAIRVKDPDNNLDDEAPIIFEGVSITGSAANREAILIDERQGCEFRDLFIRQTGENRNGFQFYDSNALIKDTVINVTGTPVVLDGESDVRQVNVDVPGLVSRRL